METSLHCSWKSGQKLHMSKLSDSNHSENAADPRKDSLKASYELSKDLDNAEFSRIDTWWDQTRQWSRD